MKLHHVIELESMIFLMKVLYCWTGMKFQKVVLLMVDHIHAGPKALQARYLLDVSETFHLYFTHDDVINQW